MSGKRTVRLCIGLTKCVDEFRTADDALTSGRDGDWRHKRSFRVLFRERGIKALFSAGYFGCPPVRKFCEFVAAVASLWIVAFFLDDGREISLARVAVVCVVFV